MKIIRLAPDYFCYPLWHDDSATSGEFGDIDPQSLLISSALSDALIKWAQWYEKDLNMADPGNSPCMGIEERNKFIAEGEKLLADLRKELGPNYVVNRAF